MGIQKSENAHPQMEFLYKYNHSPESNKPPGEKIHVKNTIYRQIHGNLRECHPHPNATPGNKASNKPIIRMMVVNPLPT